MLLSPRLHKKKTIARLECLCFQFALFAFSIQLFRQRLSNKTVRDNAERYYGKYGLMVFDWGFRCFSDIEGNSTNKCIYACSFLVGKHLEPQSINAKLFLPIIPIGIVAYAFTLLWDNLCRTLIPNHSNQHMAVCGLSLLNEAQKAAKL